MKSPARVISLIAAFLLLAPVSSRAAFHIAVIDDVMSGAGGQLEHPVRRDPPADRGQQQRLSHAPDGLQLGNVGSHARRTSRTE